ncbi:MAG: chromosomal replication initiator protein DnaA [Treponema sp.]|jgi:chromosomal replication initiator protein|nr:chromosomal replication initiator protein DnaA [Treponema sp.]
MTEWDYTIFWNEALKQIRGEKGEQEFAMWFTQLEYLGAGEALITIGVPSSFYRDQVKQRGYQQDIEAKIFALMGKKISLDFEVKPRTESKASAGNRTAPPRERRTENQDAPWPPSQREAPPDAAERTPGAQPDAERAKKPRHGQLREDYTFNRYVIGDNNNFASNAAQAIARNPGTAYNPFLIYGGVGLGKTHLMQAIGNYVHEHASQKIIYITAESFTNEFVLCIKEDRMAAFKNKYRYVDILLIDDIHFLENKWETQEELFHTFNALHDAKKQIVFTCDRPASELKKINDRLRSRFERGLNVDLQPPNYETRCAILKKKVEPIKILIPEEVITLIAKNISTNVRDLEAALTKLIAYAELLGRPITIDIAFQQLKDVFASPKQTNMSIDIIQRVVADYFALSPNDLKGKKKTQNIVHPRQLAMYIAREITEYSTTEVGQSFGGRDHTTVMHSCQKIEERIRADPTMDSTIQTLIRMIKEYNAKT